MAGFSKAAIGRRMASKGTPPQFGKKKTAKKAPPPQFGKPSGGPSGLPPGLMGMMGQ